MTVVTLNVEVKLRDPLPGVKKAVVPVAGRPVFERTMVGSPIVEEPGVSVNVTCQEFFPVSKASRLLGAVTVKS